MVTTQAWGPRRFAMGRAPEWRWADTMREAHPPTVEEAKPTKPSHDQARGGRPAGAAGAKPLSRHQP